MSSQDFILVLAIALSLLKVAKFFRKSRDASPPLSSNSNITNFVVAMKLQLSMYLRYNGPKFPLQNWGYAKLFQKSGQKFELAVTAV